MVGRFGGCLVAWMLRRVDGWLVRWSDGWIDDLLGWCVVGYWVGGWLFVGMDLWIGV